MARFEFRYNYRFGNAVRYYGNPQSRADDLLPLDAFVIDHLNTSRQTAILGMSNIRRQAEATVRRMSRVDTGLMRSSVTGTGDFGTDVLRITFGWEELYPYYAPFQEFGTRNGIIPMRAVHTAFHQALAATRRLFS